MVKVVSDSAGRRGARPLGVGRDKRLGISMHFVLISKIGDTVGLS